MEKAGVPLVPGYHGDEQADSTCAEADRIGYPGADQGRRPAAAARACASSTRRRLQQALAARKREAQAPSATTAC
jgi:3-methylcrotonyl-CoA carboxylase alpha subunit